MENPRAWASFVVVLLVVGAVVWALRASPGLSLLALLGALAVWEAGRRSRYRHSLRFLPAPRTGARRATVGVPPVRARADRTRPPWHRSSGSAAAVRRH